MVPKSHCQNQVKQALAFVAEVMHKQMTT